MPNFFKNISISDDLNKVKESYLFPWKLSFRFVNSYRMGRGNFAEFPQETSMTHHCLCITLIQGRENLLPTSFSTAFLDILQKNDFSK